MLSSLLFSIAEALISPDNKTKHKRIEKEDTKIVILYTENPKKSTIRMSFPKMYISLLYLYSQPQLSNVIFKIMLFTIASNTMKNFLGISLIKYMTFYEEYIIVLKYIEENLNN